MEEINLKDLLQFVLKKISIIILITMFIFMVGVVYTVFFKTPLYNGNTTLILVKKETPDSNSTLTQNDIVLNQKLVATYSEIIKSRRVLNQVVDRLNLDYTASQLSKKITVSNIAETEIIKISVSDENNEDAVKIADMIAEVFCEEVMEIYNLENVSIIDKAEVQNNPYNIHLTRDFIIFFMIGFVVSMGVVFVVYYFDTSVKSSEEIENRLGIAVIGSIPMAGKGGKK